MDNTGFFEEGPGTKSITRVAFIMLIIYAMIITSVLVFQHEYAYALTMFTTVTGVAFGGKLYQKHQEKWKVQKN